MSTRKIVGHRKVNPDGLLEVDLHRMLNRIDVEKDAVQPATSIREGYSVFSDCADELFGKMEYSYAQSDARVIRAIYNYSTYVPAPLIITNMLPMHSSIVIPAYIELVIQDAGFSPKQHLPYLKNVVTPGSYLDPASRSPGDIWSEFGTLDHDEFVSLGFHTIESLKSELYPDHSCEITLQFKDDAPIVARFQSDFKVHSGHTHYFSGNTYKNSWFNSSANKKEGKRYILCKELRDTLQAYYALKFLPCDPHPHRSSSGPPQWAGDVPRD